MLTSAPSFIQFTHFLAVVCVSPCTSGMNHFYSTVVGLGALTGETRADTGPSSEADILRHKTTPLNTRPKQERKHRSYTVCEVCNIQLNSAAQAQIHYNGKTHQKRLKHMNSGNTGRTHTHTPIHSKSKLLTET